MRIKKKIVATVLAMSMVLTPLPVAENKEAVAATTEQNIVIVIDPGHGGNDSGAVSKFPNGKKYKEKDLNLCIARYMRQELETYKGVTVKMTRTTDKYVTIPDRVKFAKNNKADYLFSIHLNTDSRGNASGAYALISYGGYHKELANAEKIMANLALDEIYKASGIKNKGYLLRKSNDTKYVNGKTADYYNIVNGGIREGFPSMILEHGFMDSPKDQPKMDSSGDWKALGVADATAVAKYFGLKKKTGKISYNAKGPRIRFTTRNWMKKDNRYYFVQNDETFKKGWFKSGAYKYYGTNSGAVAVGKVCISNRWYIFDGNGHMKTGWQKHNGKMHYMASGGQAYTSLRGISGELYYFNAKGEMQTGWLKLTKGWYLFGEGGRAYRNCSLEMNGKIYKFEKLGVCTNYNNPEIVTTVAPTTASPTTEAPTTEEATTEISQGLESGPEVITIEPLAEPTGSAE